MNPSIPEALEFHWLTPDRWNDLETLFGSHGAYYGCWCMYWRLRGKEFENGCGVPNQQAFQSIVQNGSEPGILVYDKEQPIGWIALAPREEYPRLAHSKILAPVDDQPVWSITCFYIARAYRKKGLTLALVEAACRMAKEKGVKILESYPVEPQDGQTNDSSAYVGIASTFRKAEFTEVARRSAKRLVMRKAL
jgi:GNAT superfamily N-acetyltransferase